MSQKYAEWSVARVVPKRQWHNVRGTVESASGEQLEKILFEWWNDKSAVLKEVRLPIEIISTDAQKIAKMVISQSVGEYQFGKFGMAGFLWQNLNWWRKFLKNLGYGYEILNLEHQAQLLEEVELFCEENESSYNITLNEVRKIEDEEEAYYFVRARIPEKPDHLSPVLGLESCSSLARHSWLDKHRAAVLECVQA